MPKIKEVGVRDWTTSYNTLSWVYCCFGGWEDYKEEKMENREIVGMIETLIGFTKTAKLLLSSLQESLDNLQKTTKEADDLIDSFSNELSKKEVAP